MSIDYPDHDEAGKKLPSFIVKRNEGEEKEKGAILSA